ncbi:INTERPRO: probable CcdB protein, possible toxin of addiction system (plasmid) [Aromatoleum aromaticum EbN1]|uniref:INTERPRO: probable CcdB protein, possible toxin of addiction system n=1 Tax=Aromatoleum aromaticum (strain DSM 19018 / LMG 30748 / EbN1) TaxID=76114 RepID=Q5NXA8_AROAE|nr:INTERPRO: probable CcdB protein, possible toxin of addiction system [Aromatoleum aromaticum EbN1]
MCTLSIPRPGEVVKAWMPETEEVCSPGRKFRPVFVVATDDRNGRTEVLCVYGTSQHIDRIGRGEFVVSCSDLPLEKPTKFSFRKMFWLPLDKTYFTDYEQQVSFGNLPVKYRRMLAFAAKEAGLG